MANKKYVSLARLSDFLDNLKAKFSELGHKHTIADITDYRVDTSLSPTSTNPVQNKVLDAEFDAMAAAMGALELAIDGKAPSSHDHNNLYYTETEIDSKLSPINTHVADTNIHVTTTNKSNWNSAYTHSTSAHARTDATKVEDSTTNGNIKINGTETNVYSHPSSGVTAGTYKSVTVNAQGHITGGTNPTTLSGYGITDAESKGAASNALASAKEYTDTVASKKSDTTHNHDSAYDTKGAAADSLASAKSYTDTKVSNLASTSTVDTKISTHNTSTSAHNDIRELISGLTTRLNTLANSDDTTLDQMSEVVTYIKNNKSLIDGITTSKVNVSDIVNNLTTNVTNKPLSAAQGVAIKGLIDALQEELDSHTHEISDINGLTTSLANKAEKNHGTHVAYLVADPLMDGEAAAGSKNEVARADHRHPTDTSRASKLHIHPYGVCTSSSGWSTKTVSVDNFSLVEGVRIAVKFENANTASSPQLNVNNTGAKPIVRYGTTKVGTTVSNGAWEAGAIVPFTYDGTNWVMDYWHDTTYSNASLGSGLAYCSTSNGTELTAGLSKYEKAEGGIVSVEFVYNVPASATLNINSKGASEIYYKGEAIPKNLIQGGDTATFIYYSMRYHLLSIDRWHDDIASLKSDMSKKSDWNQNNSYAADYIKNRTHYTEPQLRTVLTQRTVSNGSSLSGLESTTPSNTYIVTVDGTKYQCNMWVNTYGENCYGDSRITTVYDDSTGTEITDMTNPEDTPFYINACADEGEDPSTGLPILVWNWYILFNSNFKYTSHVIKIETPTGVTIYHTLDERFIPNSVARANAVNALSNDLYETQTQMDTKVNIATMTTAEYNALENPNANTLYMLTDAEEEKPTQVQIITWGADD